MRYLDLINLIGILILTLVHVGVISITMMVDLAIKCFSMFFLCRRRLFNIINDLPTIFEVVTNIAKKQVKEKSSTANGSKSKSSFKSVCVS